MHSALHSLPHETLLDICDLLHHDHPPSLLAFACTSSKYYAAAAPLLVRTLKLIYRDSSRLLTDIQGCTRMLDRAANFRHVRRLIVVPAETTPLQQQDRSSRGSSLDSAGGNEVAHWRPAKTTPAERSDEDTFSTDLANWSYTTGSYASIDEIYISNKVWEPLAAFLSRLSSLRDFVYDCRDPLPPCLLNILHSGSLPSVRLHVTLNRLPCFFGKGVHEYEKELLTSPRLYRVTLQYAQVSGSTADCYANYHWLVLRQMVMGRAKNLRVVREHHDMLHVGSSDSDADGEEEIMQAASTVVEPDLDENTTNEDRDKRHKRKATRPKGSLTSLELSDENVLTHETVEQWADTTDFSVLKSLALLSFPISSAIQYLTNNCDLSALETLHINLDPGLLGPRTTIDFFEEVMEFLVSLPPLSSLTLTGFDSSEIHLEPILSQHGPSLSSLHIHPMESKMDSFSPYALASPVRFSRVDGHWPAPPPRVPYCHNHITSLSIPLERRIGIELTPSSYEYLGHLFPNLTHLNLTLDASDRSVLNRGTATLDPTSESGRPLARPLATFDNFDSAPFTGDRVAHLETGDFGVVRVPRNGHITEALMKGAVDAVLARDIFVLVAKGQAKCHASMNANAGADWDSDADSNSNSNSNADSEKRDSDKSKCKDDKCRDTEEEEPKEPARPLQKLSISVKGADDLGGDLQLLPGLRKLLHLMRYSETGGAGGWVVERDVRDGHQSELIVAPARSTMSEAERKMDRHPYVRDADLSGYEAVFRRIWPESEGSGSAKWWEEWESLPLVGSSDKKLMSLVDM